MTGASVESFVFENSPAPLAFPVTQPPTHSDSLIVGQGSEPVEPALKPFSNFPLSMTLTSPSNICPPLIPAPTASTMQPNQIPTAGPVRVSDVDYTLFYLSDMAAFPEYRMAASPEFRMAASPEYYFCVLRCLVNL